MWQIIKSELRDRRWSLFALCLGSIFMLWLYVATFRSSQSSSQQLQELVKTYPKALLDALGLNNFSLDTLEKYLNAKHFSMIWPLMAIILALSRAANQIAGEIQNGTMGLLLSLPLERWRIFVAKYISGLITIACFVAVSVFAVIPLAMPYDIPTHFSVLCAAWVLCSLFMWVIYSLALSVSAWVNEKGAVYAVVSAFLILNYVAFILGLINDKFSYAKHISLFYYFNTQETLATGHIAARSLIIFGIIIVLASGLAVWRFNRRDISV